MTTSLQQTTEAIPVWRAWKNGEITAAERDARLAAIDCTCGGVGYMQHIAICPAVRKGN
jgi:hypothetical protein